MKQLKDFGDERNKAWCVHCGAWLHSVPTNRDHVPSKVFLSSPLPPNLPIVQVCRSCNGSFSEDEEYVAAFLGVVLAGNVDPLQQVLPAAERILRHSPRIAERISAARTERDGILLWRPEAERVHRVVVKNARGHALYELGLPMLDEPSVVWLTGRSHMSNEAIRAFEFVSNPLDRPAPEVGSRTLDRVVFGHDLVDGWIVVQPGTYRYVAEQLGDGVTVRIVIHEQFFGAVHWDSRS